MNGKGRKWEESIRKFEILNFLWTNLSEWQTSQVNSEAVAYINFFMDVKTTRKSGSNPDLLSPIPKSKLGFSESALLSPPYSCLTNSLHWLRFPAISLVKSNNCFSQFNDSLGGWPGFFISSRITVLQPFRFPPGGIFRYSHSSNSNTALGMSDGFKHRTCPSHFIRRFLMVKGIRSHFAMDNTNSPGRSCPFWRLNFWGQILLLAV